MADVMVGFTISGRPGQECPEGAGRAFIDEVRSWVEARNGRFDGEIVGKSVAPFVAFRFKLPVWTEEERKYVSKMLTDFAKNAFDDKTCIRFSFDHLIVINDSPELRGKLPRQDTLPKLKPVNITEGEGEGLW